MYIGLYTQTNGHTFTYVCKLPLHCATISAVIVWIRALFFFSFFFLWFYLLVNSITTFEHYGVCKALTFLLLLKDVHQYMQVFNKLNVWFILLVKCFSLRCMLGNLLLLHCSKCTCFLNKSSGAEICIVKVSK